MTKKNFPRRMSGTMIAVAQMICALSLMLAGTRSVLAQCTSNRPFYSVNWGPASDIVINPATAPGTEIWSTTVSPPSATYSCGGSAYISSYDQRVGATTIPGAPGLAWRVSRNGAVISENDNNVKIPVSVSLSTNSYTEPSSSYRLALVRESGALASVALTAPAIAGSFYFSGMNPAASFWLLPYGTPPNIIISNPTCTVTTTSITIALGNVNVSAFKGKDTFAGAGSGTVSLTCANSPSVTMALNGTRVTGYSNVLALNGSVGVAQGVGVQLLYNNNPLTVGSGSISLGTAGSNLNVPISARYYQAANAMTAGSANATGTLQFTYN